MAVEWHGDEFTADIRRGAMAGVVRGTELVVERATELIQSPPKTGRIYTRRGVKHQASAPGEAPATDTGTLVQRVDTAYNTAELEGTATWHAKHAPAMEFGTERIAPRPFARRALSEKEPEIQTGFAEEIAAALGGGAARTYQGG